MRTVWHFLALVVKKLWRLITFLRTLCCNLIFLLVVAVIAVGTWQFFQPDTHTGRRALLLNIKGTIVDNPSDTSRLTQLRQSLSGADLERSQLNSVFDVVDTIRQAQEDPNISGMVLSLDQFVGGDTPSLNYIGKALKAFRDNGKPIYATGYNYSQAQYYLASFASEIWLAPDGMVDLHGLSVSSLYYKTLLNKLKVSTHVFRVGTYKSAVEPFLRNDMSDAAREANSRWITAMWKDYLSVVAANRRLTPEQLFPPTATLIEEMKKVGGDAARYALTHRLVDKLYTSAQAEKRLSALFGWDKKQNAVRVVSLYDYSSDDDTSSTDNQRIAVLFAEGTIMSGHSIPGAIGGDTLAAQIREARLDPGIKAIILRVNSPGGSVDASEMIRSELAQARAAGKPVVVSMGGMAASGGYWISTPANYIIAHPDTLTGSIGIFGVAFTLENSLAELGVNSDGVSTSPLAQSDITQPMPAETAQLMQLSIENGYRRFVSLVAKSRGQTPEQIDRIAQGRVWIGRDAKANGLVDQLGDFDDAVQKAAELAKLQNWELDWYVKQPGLFDSLLDQFTLSAQALLPQTLSAWLPAPWRNAVEASWREGIQIKQLNDARHRYALCLNCAVVR